MSKTVDEIVNLAKEAVKRIDERIETIEREEIAGLRAERERLMKMLSGNGKVARDPRISVKPVVLDYIRSNPGCTSATVREALRDHFPNSNVIYATCSNLVRAGKVTKSESGGLTVA